MIEYSAYTRLQRTFPTFEEAVAFLEGYLGVDGMEVVAVSILTEEGSHGATAEFLDGIPTEVISTSQAFIVTVTYEVMGKVFKFDYVVEFGLKPLPEPEPEIVPEPEEEEEIENESTEDGTEPDSPTGDEETDPQPDEGSGETGEEPGDFAKGGYTGFGERFIEPELGCPIYPYVQKSPIRIRSLEEVESDTLEE